MDEVFEEGLCMIYKISYGMLGDAKALGEFTPHTEFKDNVSVFQKACLNTFSKFYTPDSAEYQIMSELANPKKLTVERYADFVNHIDATIRSYRAGLLKIIPSNKPDIFTDGYMIMDEPLDLDDTDDDSPFEGSFILS